MRQQLSIHGRDKSGKQTTLRYNAGGIENEPIPTGNFVSRRAAARASREAGNTGGPSCSKRR